MDKLYEDIFVRRFLIGGVFRLFQQVDTSVIDGAVNGAANTAVGTGKAVRRVQTGAVPALCGGHRDRSGGYPAGDLPGGLMET